MALFKPAKENIQANLKMGVFGEAGSGKTLTSSLFALGFLKDLAEKDAARAAKPVFFLDTESGSDFVVPRFEAAGHQVMTLKTRAFTDLIPALQEASKESSVLLIDSITHFWEEFTRSYAERNKRTRGLQMLDWQYLKNEWNKFTTELVATDVHYIMAGRAGFEYEFNVDEESGKKDMERSGVKMKGESSMAYEPNLLLYMQRQQEMDGKDVSKTYHTGTVVKDRTDTIDGQMFTNPTYQSIRPHVMQLALGSKHASLDTSRTSVHAIPKTNGKTQWQMDQEEKERVLEEIKDVLNKHHGGTSNDAKEKKAQLIEQTFGTRTWSRVEQMPAHVVQNGRDRLWLELEKVPYKISLPELATAAELEGYYLPGSAEAEAAEANTKAATATPADKKLAEKQLPLDADTMPASDTEQSIAMQAPTEGAAIPAGAMFTEQDGPREDYS